MARTTIDISASLADAWSALQLLPTWDGVAGIEDLREPRHDSEGNLVGFRFAMDTAVGRVDGHATVTSARPSMAIHAEQKGLEIRLHVELRQVGGRLRAQVEARSRAVSFFNKPLELTLNALLENSIRDEAALIASRVSQVTE